ncbi:GNAT family N-acetyltransferase [Nocardioides panacisoli]|uniref:GNAT family N-acetyltransferase n=1 Tax=Nocardioides panacisoli TaxID=627624 RepID=UPI001C636460|nr:GNAT family N-acetyltransferase [Nocardioides panacisoli]QYJ05814.1 GNAT family N-acetyltransferase [Nocardioides panacisoli]
MLWRIRVTLPDRPGTLAALARECGAAGVNILTVQVFTPASGTVTDELVVRSPEAWAEEDFAPLVAAAGGTFGVALPCSEAAVVDQPTRYVDAARAVLAQPASFPEVVARLFDADTEPADRAEDVMELAVGPAVVQVRRSTPFTATEHARGAAMAQLVTEVIERVRPPEPTAAPGELAPEYVASEGTVTALVAGAVVGRASVTPGAEEDAAWQVDLWVDDRWQRRGIGRRLLADVVRIARTRDVAEVVLTAPATSRAVLPVVLSAGLRGRIRMSGDSLVVRIPLADVKAPAVRS